MTEKYKLKQGYMVVMHTCMEHDHPDNFGKIWTCKTDSFRHKGHDYDSIFLEGFSGSFSTQFLQKVDMTETQKTISDLSTRLQFHDDHADSDHQAIEQLIAEKNRLRKALEGALLEAENGLNGSLDMADEAINKIVELCEMSLGEEVES